MPSRDSRPPLVVLVGPTAVGKTAISTELARRIDAEIISADSRLFYRGLDIGTDKPAPDVRAAIPHHLLDFLDPDEPFSLAEFQTAVLRIAGEIPGRGRTPLLVGGTGQYVRAIVEGWRIPAQPPDESLRNALTAFMSKTGPETAGRWLTALDPAAADWIDPRNTRRLVRALEVILSTGRPFSDQRLRSDPHFRSLLIGLNRPRAELYQRIDERIDAMLAAGLVAEVAGLIAAGYSPELPSMSAIGYREAARHLRGELDIDGVAASMRKRSRTLVRRQANWFKPDDPDIHWFEVDGGTIDRIEELALDFLTGRNPV